SLCGQENGPRTRKLFVGGLPPSMTDEEFTSYFARFGTITEIQVLRDEDEKARCRGFGFVTFQAEQAAEDVLLVGKMHEICGKMVEVKKAQPRKDMAKLNGRWL
ncbi:unnamed protein product, partial [Closterium sp. NIES-53]